MQHIDGLKVEPLQTAAGTWWTWKDRQGHQIHAGMDTRQWVNGPLRMGWYVLKVTKDGPRWARKEIEDGQETETPEA